MEEFSALSFNVRETLWKVESIRQKILKLNPGKELEEHLHQILKENINSSMSALLIVYDTLSDIENYLEEYQITFNKSK